jgi:enterochelin esterase-like enzyme
MKFNRGLALAALLPALALSGAASSRPEASGPIFTVRMDAPGNQSAKGRLIILAQPATPDQVKALAEPATTQDQADHRAQDIVAAGADNVDFDPSPSSGSAAAARAGVTLAPGQSVTVDADDIAYPAFSKLPPGPYLVQAVLDTHGKFAYDQALEGGDLVSDVVAVTLPVTHATLSLKTRQPDPLYQFDAPPPAQRPPAPGHDAAWLKQAQAAYDAAQITKPHTERAYFRSKLLTDFWKAPTDIRAYILTPPGYDRDKSARYPVAFETEGFGATFGGNFTKVQRFYAEMASGVTPPMIWVFLDHAGPTGTHEFADSANNGPWGQALTTEFIPWLDAKYRTDGTPSGRFTTGHSSGGWSSLWLQVAYPKLFGGAWPTSPDPVDFHDFTNIDLYAPRANAYTLPNGKPTELVRSRFHPATFEQYAKAERVLGPVGGQISSFDWVFSPRGPDGKPAALFDPKTGIIDPEVAAYWIDHYDIAAKIKREWPVVKPDLDGKIHYWVGTLDTYYLDGPAHRLKAVLDGLGARSEFHFIDGADHGTVMFDGPDHHAVEHTIAWQMYITARPGTKRPPVRSGPEGKSRSPADE